MLLTDEQKKEIHQKLDNIEVEVEELDSYQWDSNPYCVEPQLVGTSGCGSWDEDEEYEAKKEKLKDWIESDGVWEYVTVSDDDYEDEDKMEKLKEEVIDYIDNL